MHRKPITGLDLARHRLALRGAIARALASNLGQRGAQAALELERSSAQAKPMAHGDQVVWSPFVPTFPSPGFDRFLIAAMTGRDYRPLVIADVEPPTGIGSVRALLSEPSPIGVLALRGDALYADPSALEAMVAEASSGAQVWLITSGRRLTASIAERLARAGVIGAAIGFWDASPAEQDRAWGRKSWDDAAAAIGLFDQAGILPTMIVEPRPALITADGLRPIHRLAAELGAAFVTWATGPASLEAVRELDAVRNNRPAFADYPGLVICGDDGDHWPDRLFANGVRLRPVLPAQVSHEPEPPLTGMDLPEPPPHRRHPTAALPGRVGGGVIDALLRRTADLASRK
jgi:hypothetical protein